MQCGCALATAESCTGGGIAALLTSVAGSSAYFRGGIVAYQNDVKETLLGVDSEQVIGRYGVVSKQTVEAMAKGVMKLLKADCAIATSGIAGPGGAESGKPVGTIWIAAACRDRVLTRVLQGDNGRLNNVNRAITEALELFNTLMTEKIMAER